ncbi:MAG: TetR/AcrR family transcriptional regulator [Leptospira sp.]|nr:TetR/AcrR family transcriptional regulator [Leptospira sp.]
MSLKVEQGEETKRQILKAARKLFGKKGYNETSLEDIYSSLKLTRGAFYHHFSSKKEVFFEMCRAYNQELVFELESWDWKEFRKRWQENLDLTDDKNFVQIWIKDLTSVLTTKEMNQLDEESIEKTISILLENAIRKGSIKKIPIKETSQLIIGMLNQSLLLLSELEGDLLSKSKKNIIKVMDMFLDSLEI